MRNIAGRKAKFKVVVTLPVTGYLLREVKECLSAALREYGGQFMPEDERFLLFRNCKVSYLKKDSK